MDTSTDLIFKAICYLVDYTLSVKLKAPRQIQLNMIQPMYYIAKYVPCLTGLPSAKGLNQIKYHFDKIHFQETKYLYKINFLQAKR